MKRFRLWANFGRQQRRSVDLRRRAEIDTRSGDRIQWGSVRKDTRVYG